MKQKSQENSKFIVFYRLYKYIFILFHIFIIFIAFYNMKLKFWLFYKFDSYSMSTQIELSD